MRSRRPSDREETVLQLIGRWALASGICFVLLWVGVLTVSWYAHRWYWPPASAVFLMPALCGIVVGRAILAGRLR